MILRSLVLTMALGAVAVAQSTTPPAAPAPAQDLPDAPSTTSNAQPPVEPTGLTVLIDTSMGRLTCKLFDKQAPIASANFIGLAEGTKEWTDPRTQQKVKNTPFYDGLTFHRVIPGFMIQGGDRLGDGTGDAGYLFENEVDPALNFDVPGRLAMANAGPNTNGTQFFVTEVAVPDLNGKYTIFGQCDPHSVLVVASIARVERDPNDKPVSPVFIKKVTVLRAGQPIPPDPMAPHIPPPAPPPTAAPPAP